MRRISLLLVFISIAQASHNLAGQITYKRIGANTYEILLTTYTDPIARGVDRCSATIEIWNASGTQLIDRIENIPRENGPTGSRCTPPERMGEFIRPRIKKNYYRAVYTFPGPGVYQLRYADYARVENVINMTNSGNTAFYVYTYVNNLPTLGANNSVQLLNDPLDDACIGKLWTHNPGAYDPDGDSLSFQLIPNLQYHPDPSIGPTVPMNVQNYQYPDAFGGIFTIDPQTGLITWNTPQQVGVYTICILIEEWRNGRKIAETIRDMAIFVVDCNNNPPEILAPDQVCVYAQDTLNILIQVDDPDNGDSVYVYLNNGGRGNNGPFQLPNQPPQLTPPLSAFPLQGFPIIQIQMQWTPLCEHIRSKYYQVDFYAHDNLTNSPPLHADKIVKIWVLPPPMDSLWAWAQSRSVLLQWNPAQCNNVVAYRIYRSEFVDSLERDSCCNASALTNHFSFVAEVPAPQTTYVDSPLVYRGQYCYAVTAVYPDGSESCPTIIRCVRLKRSYPLLNKVSVVTTDVQNGAIDVGWYRPDLNAIDTNFFPKPYFYRLYRGTGFTPTSFTLIADNIPFDDTTFQDVGLNTVANPYAYKIELYDATRQLIDQGNQASSIYLQLQPAQNAMLLDWQEVVPWHNERYVIFRQDPGSPTFVPIDTVLAPPYLDKGLSNGVTYCYFVRSIGSYRDTALAGPLLNDSQVACDYPRDSIPPCMPSPDSLNIYADCEQFQVVFQVTLPPDSCGGDIGYYEILWAPHQGEEPVLIATIDTNTLTYTFTNVAEQSIAGCYYLRAVDTSGNRSQPYEYCFENCPVLVLPNVFTPNGDGVNDVFKPIKVRSIERLEIEIFDRWGRIVHRSTDMERLWDGKINNGAPAVEGVYFYRIKIFPKSLYRNKVLVRTGHITLIR